METSDKTYIQTRNEYTPGTLPILVEILLDGILQKYVSKVSIVDGYLYCYEKTKEGHFKVNEKGDGVLEIYKTGKIEIILPKGCEWQS